MDGNEYKYERNIYVSEKSLSVLKKYGGNSSMFVGELIDKYIPEQAGEKGGFEYAINREDITRVGNVEGKEKEDV